MYNFFQLVLLNCDRFIDRMICQEEYILVVKYIYLMYGIFCIEYWLEVRIFFGIELL